MGCPAKASRNYGTGRRTDFEPVPQASDPDRADDDAARGERRNIKTFPRRSWAGGRRGVQGSRVSPSSHSRTGSAEPRPNGRQNDALGAFPAIQRPRHRARFTIKSVTSDNATLSNVDPVDTRGGSARTG